jgi:hypothetical protein
LATIFFITKERKHEKGNYWGLVEFGSDYGLGIVYDSHHHVWWANRHLHNLLLWQQLHNKLFLITMFRNMATFSGGKGDSLPPCQRFFSVTITKNVRLYALLQV